MRLISLISFVLFVSYSDSLRLYLNPNQRKCLKEEIHKNVVVTGEYELSEAAGHKADVHVRNLHCAINLYES